MELLDQVFFTIAKKDFTYLALLRVFLIISFFIGLYFFIVKKLVKRGFGKTPEQIQSKRKVVQTTRIVLCLITLISLLWSLDLDYILHETTTLTISLTTILQVVLIIQFARLLDWFFSKFLIYNYEKSREGVSEEEYNPRKVFDEKKIS